MTTPRPSRASDPLKRESGTPVVLELENGARVEAELGWVDVPVRHARPDGPHWRLAYARLPARTSRPGAPIVILAGGPGESGIQALGWDEPGRLEFWQELRELGDVIALDQRGTGWSWPVTLPTRAWDLPLDEVLDAASFHAVALDRCRETATRWGERGIDLGAYTVLEAADDIEVLRQALGAERLRLVGASYGSHLGFAVLRRHGERVERAVLSLVEGPDQTYKLPSRVQAALEGIAGRAREANELHGVVPDLLGMVGELLGDLTAAPRRLHVAATEVLVGPYDLQRAIADCLGDQAELASLPARLLALSQGDGSWLAAAAIERRREWPSSVMTYHTDAASGASAQRRRQIDSEKGRFLLGDVINHPFPEIEAALGWPDIGDEARSPIRTDVPVQFESGALDGRTPIANVEDIKGGFSSAGHLIVDGVAHDEAFALPDVRDLLRAFLAGADPADASVAAPFSFLPPG